MAAEDALVLIALNAQVLQKKGDAAFRLGDFQGSFSNYSQAIGLLESLPDSYPPERPMLMAKCKAGLSGACGGLTRLKKACGSRRRRSSSMIDAVFWTRLGLVGTR